MQQPPARNNSLLTAIYLIFMMGAAGLTVFIHDAAHLTSAGASAVFFGLMGLISLGFHLRGEGRPFARFAKVWSVLAFVSLIWYIFQAVSLHPALIGALVAFAAAIGLTVIYQRRRSVPAPAASQPVKEWQQLGPGAASLADQQRSAAHEAPKSQVPR